MKHHLVYADKKDKNKKRESAKKKNKRKKGGKQIFIWDFLAAVHLFWGFFNFGLISIF